MLVVDASVAIAASLAEDGYERFHGEALVAPQLLWSEVRSALHESLWRGDISRPDAERGLASLARSGIRPVDHERLGSEAWRIADRLGWMKTYDAEYLALAILRGCELATLDAGLRLAAERLGVARPL